MKDQLIALLTPRHWIDTDICLPHPGHLAAAGWSTKLRVSGTAPPDQPQGRMWTPRAACASR